MFEYFILKISEILNLNELQEKGVSFILFGTFIFFCTFLFWRYYKTIGVKRGKTLTEGFKYASYTRSIVGMFMGGILIAIGIFIILFNIR